MRIAGREISDYPIYVRLFLSAQIKKYGAALNSSLLWARSPRLFLALSFLYGALDRKSSPISPVLRSLILVRVSQINVCTFCIDLNSAIILERGIPVSKLEALSNWQSSDLFTAPEKAVLEYTEAMTLSDREVTNDMFQKLKEFFSEDEIIELTATIAFQNMSTKFNSALDVPAQGFCNIVRK